MKIKPNINTKRIKRKIKKLPGVLSEKAFAVFLALFFFELILGIFVFYRYTFSFQENNIDSLPETIGAEPPAGSIRLNEKALESVLKKIEENQKKFEETEHKTYPDFFRSEEVKEELEQESEESEEDSEQESEGGTEEIVD